MVLEFFPHLFMEPQREGELLEAGAVWYLEFSACSQDPRQAPGASRQPGEEDKGRAELCFVSLFAQ